MNKIRKKMTVNVLRKIKIRTFVAENENKNANQSDFICPSKAVTAIFV
jgi:hypothetical protein